jgi:hypothetical protein
VGKREIRKTVVKVLFIARLLATGLTALAATNAVPLAWGQSPRQASESPGAEQAGEIVTLRYFRIKKGSFPQFLEASKNGVWPYYEKIGARILGMWLVTPGPGQKHASDEYDEVYLSTRYVSLDHWSATRDPVSLGGEGLEAEALQAGLKVRQSLTLETRVIFMSGLTGPMPPTFARPTDNVQSRERR